MLDRGRHGSGWQMVLAVAAVGIAAGCGHRHPERTPEGTLQRLRDSLVNGSPPLTSVADPRVLHECSVLLQAGRIQNQSHGQFTDGALEQLLSTLAHQMDPHYVFAGVAPMLRQGHCVKLGDGTMPDEMHTIPEPGEHWGPQSRALQVSVARRMSGAYASDWRCDGGPSFRAVFVHADPDDGSLRVAQIGPSGVR